ncbi:hypothetical protein CI102_10232 [Trichoderma harzianum]|nr:hypothetical protein CI102_10232 [Trichoderma harzianum]
MRAARTVVSDQSDPRDNRQPALYWPGPQSTTPLMLMPATSPWFPRDPTSFVSPYAVEPWLRPRLTVSPRGYAILAGLDRAILELPLVNPGRQPWQPVTPSPSPSWPWCCGLANALPRPGRMKTTLAEGNLPRYGQLNSIPAQLDTLRTRDWRLPGLPRVVLRVLVLAQALLLLAPSGVPVHVLECVQSFVFSTRSIFGPPQDAAGITTSEHGTVWRPIDVVSSVATRARNFLFSNPPLCLHFRAEAALLVHSTLATGQEWRMGPWRDKDALDALDGTIPRRPPLLADGHSARSGKSTRHVPVSYEYGHMSSSTERFACWFWRAKANNLGARLAMNPATRTSAYLKRRGLRSRPVLDVSARYPTRAGADQYPICPSTRSGTRTCTDVNIGLVPACACVCAGHAGLVPVQADRDSELNWIDVTSPAKSVQYRYRLESDMPTIKTDDRGFKAVDGPKTLARATASTAARDAPGIAAPAPQPAASRASRASSTFGLAGRTIAGFNALRRPGSSSLHAWQRGQEKQKKRKEGKKGTRKSSTPACACICVLTGTGDWPSKPLRSSSLPASESQRGSSAFFASTISSPPAAASASYKYPTHALPRSLTAG